MLSNPLMTDKQRQNRCILMICNRLHQRHALIGRLTRLAAVLGLLAVPAVDAQLSAKEPLKIFPEPKAERRKLPEREPVAMPFYIFNNSIFPPAKNFCPSGYMGDVPNVMLTGSFTKLLQDGYPALKVSFNPAGGGGWAGVLWQNPPNNWGELDGGYNLSRARKLTFWARGDRGGEAVEFKFGGITGLYPDSDSRSTGEIVLTAEWKEYAIDLKGADLRYVSGGFGFSVRKDVNRNGCVFFLDNMKFEE